MLKKENTQKIISIALAYLISFPALSYAIANIFAAWKIPVLSSVALPLLYASFYAVLILAAFHTMQKTTWARLLTTVFMGLCFLVALLGERGNGEFMWTKWNDILNNPTYTFWLFSFSAFLLSDHLRDTETFSTIMERFSYTTIILALLQYLTALAKDTVPEYMTFSYNILFATAYLLILHFNKAHWLKLVTGIVGALLILIAGCRGALIGLIVSVVIFFLYDVRFTSGKRIVMIFITAAVCVLLSLFWQDILQGITGLLESLGTTSRTIEMIETESFLEDSGRGKVVAKGMAQLNVLGYGLYGDRTLLDGSYVHNIVVEMLLDFGLFLGVFVVGLVLFVIVLGLHRADHSNRMLICALFAVGVVKLFVSGSYLDRESGLFLMLGLCVNCIRAKQSDIR